MNHPNLIFEGLQLMLIGMSMVFVFLSILVFCTTAMQRFLSSEDPQADDHASSPSDDEIVAITSAIHCYRQKPLNSKEKS